MTCAPNEDSSQTWCLFKSQMPGIKIHVHNQKLIFLFLNQNICCGYSKEPSH